MMDRSYDSETLFRPQKFPSPSSHEELPGRLKLVLCLYLLACVVWFVVRTAHWKQVNDPAQLHYVCFLMDHGMAPYRDLLEINMPGAYLVNWSVMHTLGGGSVAWRVFDFGLLGVATWAMIYIAWPYDWLAGALGATLFILYHGRDGAGQEGQRDLVIAVLLLCAYAFLFRAFRSSHRWPMLGFGLCAGMSATIKPMPLPFFLLLLLAAAMRWRRMGQPIVRPLLYASLGFLLPVAVVSGFLASERALGWFWYLLHVELPYYQGLGRLSLLKTFQLLMSAPMKTMALFAVVIAWMKRELWNWEGKMLFAGVLFGAFSFIGQGKGFPYHRYPLLAFFFLWVALQFVVFLRTPGFAGIVAKAGLGFALILMPLCLRIAGSRVWAMQYMDSLTSDLSHLGGSRLSGHVQCLDTPADCDATLYNMRLVQATGLFYDYLIFGPEQQPVIREERERFWQQFEKNRPAILVVGRGTFPKEDGYEKLDSWAPLRHEIASSYALYADRVFPRGEPGQRAYRIYVDKQFMTLAGLVVKQQQR